MISSGHDDSHRESEQLMRCVARLRHCKHLELTDSASEARSNLKRCVLCICCVRTVTGKFFMLNLEPVSPLSCIQSLTLICLSRYQPCTRSGRGHVSSLLCDLHVSYILVFYPATCFLKSEILQDLRIFIFIQHYLTQTTNALTLEDSTRLT